MNEFDSSDSQIVEYEDDLDDPHFKDGLDAPYFETSSKDSPEERVPCIGEYLLFEIHLFIMRDF